MIFFLEVRLEMKIVKSLLVSEACGKKAFSKKSSHI